MPRQNYDSLSDPELLRLIQDDDDLAFKALFTRYYHHLCKLASIYISDTSRREEIISDVFVSLWTGRKKLHILDVKSYLFIAARNSCFSVLKKTTPITYTENMETYNDTVSDGRSPLSVIKSRETQQEIFQHIDALPLRQKEVLLMNRISGIKNEEIASVLGISLKTVQSTLYEAIRELRSRFYRTGQSSDT